MIEKCFTKCEIKTFERTVNESIVCEMECMRQEHGQIVDMCFVESLPFNNLPTQFLSTNEADFRNRASFVNTWNASYMHGMTRRWLPLGKINQISTNK